MAVLPSSGIYGFLCSCKETGQRLANGAKEYVEDFLPGFAGHGWKIGKRDKERDAYCLEIDQIVVRETMTVFELLIQKIRAVKGALCITQASGKIKTANKSTDGMNWLITVEDEMSFAAHDIIRCQSWEKNTLKGYWVEISEITKDQHGADAIVIPVSEFSGSIDYDEGGFECVSPDFSVMPTPAVGDEIIQFGNSALPNRQSAIYLHADEGAQPAMDVLFGVNSKSFSGCVKTRVGGDIPGADGLKGFYCENGMIKGTNSSGHTVYCVYPDGSAMFGDGSAEFNTDRSGHIAGGSISWKWDETGNKFVCTMQDVVLTWDNLSDEVKDNLKGETGAPGKDGVGTNGADGVNGKDGISMIFKGNLTDHPANPQNGWHYKNTTDKKSYVYQDGTWYQMTIDGVDGANGLDGTNGNDGLSIIWKGDSATPPDSPAKNWVYRDTDNGRVYIHNGSAWVLMVADGSNGADGTTGADGWSVFIAYHDSDIQPATPAGNGTTNGWHTAPDANCVWMSQKVGAGASSGSWGAPIRIKGLDGTNGEDANLLPWIEKWNGYATELGEEYIVTPKMFSGTNTGTSDNPVLTGIAMGRECIEIENVKRTGIFALVNNEVVFELDPESERYVFRGVIEANEGVFKGKVEIAEGKILLNEDGSGQLAAGAMVWDQEGNVTVTEKFIGDELFANRLKTVTIETEKLIAKKGSMIGNLRITEKGSLYGAVTTFDNCSAGAFHILTGIINLNENSYINHVIDNIGSVSTYMLSVQSNKGTYNINLPDYNDLQANAFEGVSGGVGFTLRFIVPSKWQAMLSLMPTEVVNNDAIFRIKAKSDAPIYNNNGGSESYIEMARGDVLELYCYVRTEFVSMGGGAWSTNYHTEYYIKSRSL